MRLITPSVEMLTYTPTLEGMYKAIEDAGRICYASTKKDESSEYFVQKLLFRGHGRPLEFGTVYAMLNAQDTIFYRNVFKEKYGIDIIDRIVNNRYTKVFTDRIGTLYITTNYRVVMQGLYDNWKDAVDNNYDKSYCFLLSPSIFQYNEGRHYKRYYFKWGISRVTADSFRTHCMLSTLMQSTRYCLYSSPKFGCEVAYARPARMNDIEVLKDNTSYDDVSLHNKLCKHLKASDILTMEGFLQDERLYKMLTSKEELDRISKELGCLPDEKALPAEEARDNLPLDVYTIETQCGFYDDWMNFFWQRMDSHAHPDAQFISKKAYELLQDKIKDYEGASL